MLLIASFTGCIAQSNEIEKQHIASLDESDKPVMKIPEKAAKNYLEARLKSLGYEAVIDSITIEKMDDTRYALYGYGAHSGNSRVIRIELETIKAGNSGNVLQLKKAGTTETCTGVECSKCAFASGGGCDCTKKVTGSGYCNHTTTTQK